MWTPAPTTEAAGVSGLRLPDLCSSPRRRGLGLRPEPSRPGSLPWDPERVTVPCPCAPGQASLLPTSQHRVVSSPEGSTLPRQGKRSQASTRRVALWLAVSFNRCVLCVSVFTSLAPRTGLAQGGATPSLLAEQLPCRLNVCVPHIHILNPILTR